ncbi:hypothetical protein PC120_g11390 [Phytophthora cactorum]|nr:hypothetical protein PC120_g11390 [Phytophthora cactorum]
MREKLRMDMTESGVHGRVIQYFLLCHEIIGDHGWRKFLPARKRTARFKTRRAPEDEVVLHGLILEKALDQEKSVPAPKAYEA